MIERKMEVVEEKVGFAVQVRRGEVDTERRKPKGLDVIKRVAYAKLL